MSRPLVTRLRVELADVPTGFRAFSKVSALSWYQIVAFAGLIDLNVYNENLGNLSCIISVLYFGVTIIVASAGGTLAYKRRREVELKHGPAPHVCDDRLHCAGVHPTARPLIAPP